MCVSPIIWILREGEGKGQSLWLFKKGSKRREGEKKGARGKVVRRFGPSYSPWEKKKRKGKEPTGTTRGEKKKKKSPIFSAFSWKNERGKNARPQRPLTKPGFHEEGGGKKRGGTELRLIQCYVSRGRGKKKKKEEKKFDFIKHVREHGGGEKNKRGYLMQSGLLLNAGGRKRGKRKRKRTSFGNVSDEKQGQEGRSFFFPKEFRVAGDVGREKGKAPISALQEERGTPRRIKPNQGKKREGGEGRRLFLLNNLVRRRGKEERGGNELWGTGFRGKRRGTKLEGISGPCFMARKGKNREGTVTPAPKRGPRKWEKKMTSSLIWICRNWGERKGTRRKSTIDPGKHRTEPGTHEPKGGSGQNGGGKGKKKKKKKKKKEMRDAQ